MIIRQILLVFAVWFSLTNLTPLQPVNSSSSCEIRLFACEFPWA